MKKLLIITIITLPFVSFSQSSCTYSQGQCLDNLQPASPYFQNLVNQITGHLEMPSITVQLSSTDNICADDQNGVSIITFNDEYLRSVRKEDTNNLIAVLAHVVGHHYQGDDDFYGTAPFTWTDELKADFVTGYILSKMEVSDADQVMQSTFSQFGTSDQSRIDAMKLGYNMGSYGE